MTLVSAGDETNISIPFKDILDNLDGVFMVYAEARWRRWFGAFDGTWVSLGDAIEGELFEIDASNCDSVPFRGDRRRRRWAKAHATAHRTERNL